MGMWKAILVGLGVLFLASLNDAGSASLITDKTFCDACCSGPAGIPGTPGAPGSHGEDGKPGKRGPRGDQGDIGYKGEPGLVGEMGPKGNNGSRGAKGFFGKLGPRGLPGNTGLKGDLGEKGERGDLGDTGEKGDQGPTGPKGVQGVQGNKGSKGQRGEPGERGITGTKGRRGDRGLLGLQGPQGPQGVGKQGPKGVPGYRGYKGEPGLPAPELMQCAFMVHAFISSGDLNHGRDEIIPFDDIITNIGRYFDIGRVKFISPIPGTYVFHFTTDFKGKLQLVKNGQTMVVAKRFSSIVIELQKSDQVWLSMVEDSDFSESHFYLSGFLLHIQFEYLANNLYVTAH
ncbi:collagen alpha-1(X) chain-like [Patiria miniata]|uniref:C1q domain-containing protein n=1 Tax=Patiria miniata TaxID=46514 RepID=A0A914BCJ9_PATMI|nr:collagen alpha-1(X) chain-like [Patiria miniata]